ncbi:MAG TPA: hydroxymethylbilane synthase [Roseimicrobium sp.]|nr:hydroxymethylbilane synthase [Roseimicrobium sp.]
MPAERPILIATRGSALALVQSNAVLAQCRAAFPRLRFELNVIKTTGDKLQTASLTQPGESLPKGLFTKELEVALLNGEADFAVHSLKDLPTELPEGLKLGAVGKRADVRDVMIYRDSKAVAAAPAPLVKSADWVPGQVVKDRRGFRPGLSVARLPEGATVATSSTRRKAQLLVANPKLNVVEIRGNVPTRLQKLWDRSEYDAIILAAAGLGRLHFPIFPDGSIRGEGVPKGLLATRLELDEMLPCVGQGAIGIESRAEDERIDKIISALNHPNTHLAVLAERAFLKGMGGGCLAPVAAHGEILGHQLRLRAVSFQNGPARRTEIAGKPMEAVSLGEEAAKRLKD